MFPPEQQWPAASVCTGASQQFSSRMVGGVMARIVAALRTVTVEPVMLVDGACKEAMLLYAENVQMNKICSVKLGLPPEVCANLSAHPEENVRVQREFSVFTFYNSIILSVLPLIFVLFMGAWSDKYGRKVPLLMTLVGHMMYAGGYLLTNWQTSWPVEVLFLVTLLEALGGTNTGFLSSTISYISDVSHERQRTSRVSTANSMWYLGAPLGTLVGALLIKYGSYNLALGLVFLAYIVAVVYVVVFIKESHGPFAKEKLRAQGSVKEEPTPEKKDVSVSTMVADFFNWRRVVESFKTAFKKREGNTRTILMAVVFGNMIRRMARGFFMYMFVRRALHWEATDYGYWITYRNLLAALGSLFLVPPLTKILAVSDSSLIVMGMLSIVGEYVCYGLVKGTPEAFLMWLGPPVGIVSNASIIAFRSMSTKLVSTKEKGRINAVMAALNGLMPMVGYAAYSPIYYKTVDTFPAAQFFFGAGLNVLIMATFIVLELMRASSSYNAQDLESDSKTDKGIKAVFKNPPTVTIKSVTRTFSGPEGRLVTHITQDSSSTQKLPGIGKPKDEKTSGGGSAVLSPSAGISGQHTDMSTCGVTDDDPSSAACCNRSPPALRTRNPATAEDFPPRTSYLNHQETEAAGCYGNRLSDAEITASERTLREVPLHDEAATDHGRTHDKET
ncbi:lysosomal proton-coupled steroid conjugate and bile acid symporter SLC46A3-like [Panulirus ornatus]|uniref:lysosomal proton-coupled steroid conjugate and bile acid symporter SLC46A3-like n=1 Tax=Panulirus ornatus TaxID=150431 RepID=UPI003A88A4C0